MPNKKKKTLRKAINMELREHRSSFIVYVILRVLIILCMIRQFVNGEYEHVFLCVLTLVLLLVPSFLQLELKIELPTALEIVILLFIFAAEILGEIKSFYLTFPHWDTALHTLNGFLMAAIGFSMVDLLNRDERLKFDLSPLFMAIMAFCFSMTVGVVWEFFEYGMDVFAGLDMQKDTIIHAFQSVTLDPTNSNIPIAVEGITEVLINGKDLGLGGYLDIGLHDTMFDLFVNFVGAVVFSTFGFFYIKYKGEGKVAKGFIPVLKAQEQDYLKKVKEDESDEV